MYADAPINYVVPSKVTSVPALPVTTGTRLVFTLPTWTLRSSVKTNCSCAVWLLTNRAVTNC